ncbi:ATP-NAD kinase-like domain-containing protein [Chytriomyces cf. hyalinus JEL632]|nr:ATP-NAD kinase-like domain-containing protein [Chytriomyces cf. hyalinus JEL632]
MKEIHIIVNSLHPRGKAAALQAKHSVEQIGRSIQSTHFTAAKGHACEIARHISTTPTTASTHLFIIVCGGDGTIHEVINGLAEGPKPLSFTLAIVPSGSANALATTLHIESIDMAMRLISNALSDTSSQHHAEPDFVLKPLRLASFAVAPPPATRDVHLDDITWPQRNCLFFCVISYGLHAQIVKHSERWRFLGNRRFQYIAWINILLLWNYCARLWTLNARSYIRKSATPLHTNPRFQQQSSNTANSDDNIKNTAIEYTGERSFSYFLTTRMTHLEQGFHISPFSDPSSADLDVVSTSTHSRVQVGKFLGGALGDAQHSDLDYVDNVKLSGFVLQPVVKRNSWFFGRGTSDVCVDGEMWTVRDGDAIWVREEEQEGVRFNVVAPAPPL